MYIVDAPPKKNKPVIIKKTKRESPFQKSSRIRLAYERMLRGVAREVKKLISNYDLSSMESIEKLKTALNQYAILIEPWARKSTQKVIIDISNQDKDAWRKHSERLSNAIKNDILNTPIGQTVKDLMEENVTLIKSIPIEAAQKVHEKVIENLSQGKRYSDFVDDILNVGNVTLSRATLIARTETARAANTFVQVRAQNVGSETYIWRTASDLVVRKSHREMNGREFRFDTPPTLSDGTVTHPGMIYNCRCFMEPIIIDTY